MQKRLDNCLCAIYMQEPIEKFLLDCDIGVLILEVIFDKRWESNNKCLLLSKIFSSTKFDINSYDRNVHPLIALCCSDGNLVLIKLLVEEMDADINVYNSAHRTPIAHAFHCGCIEIVKYLYEKGAILSYQENGKNVIFLLHGESLDALSDGKSNILVPHRKESLDSYRKNKNEIKKSKNCCTNNSTKISDEEIKHVQSNESNASDNLKICDEIEKSKILNILLENIKNIIIKRCTMDVKAHSIEVSIELLLDEILDTIINCPANTCSVFDWTKIIKISMNRMIEILGQDLEIRVVKVIDRITQSKYSHGEKYGILEEMKYYLES